VKRDELIKAIAKAAHDAHYCGFGYRGELCDHCKESGRCFELSGDTELQPDWNTSAEAALETVEKALGVRFQD
jgi:hypothetical protein